MGHLSSGPVAYGMLEVGDANAVYWEALGRGGIPALVLHGGPGSGCSRSYLSLFDLDAYRVVLFDQRGCGRSRPYAADPGTSLSANTTRHLVDDVERLRRHLGVERWVVLGHSWGSTLGLAYTEHHPERVLALVLVAVTMTRPRDVEWLYCGLRSYFPAAWERFRAGAGSGAGCDDGHGCDEGHGHALVRAYHRLLENGAPRVRRQAARDFSDWEWAVSAPGVPAPRSWSDPSFQLARSRIVTHYFAHDAWLDDGELLAGADALASLPGAMVHGHEDVGSPLSSALELAGLWPRAGLTVVPGAGHGAGEAAMVAAARAATDRLAHGTGSSARVSAP